MSQLNVTTLKHESAGVDNITLDADGNVGMGTSSPSNFSGYTTLDVVNATNGGAILARGSTVEVRVVADEPSGTVQVKAQSNHPLTFGTAGTERMRIDSAGRVTMPYQPAFTVTHSSNASLSGTIILDTPTLNIGGYYSTSTGRFTAPVGGSYYFIFAAIVGGTGEFALRFLRNGSVLTGVGYASTGGSSNDTGVVAKVIYLDAGDYVNINISSGNIEAQFTSFCGYLIG